MSPHQFGAAFRAVEPSVLAVEAVTAGGRVRHGSAVVAGADGLMLCAADTVRGARAVRVRAGSGDAHPWQDAQVLAVDEPLRLAALYLSAGPALGLPPARAARPGVLTEGLWVVAVERRVDGMPAPVAGQVRLGEEARGQGRAVAVVDTPAAPGSPLVDLQGRLVGLTLGRMDGRRAQATGTLGWRRFVRRVAGGRALRDPAPPPPPLHSPAGPP